MNDEDIMDMARAVGYDWLFPSMPLKKLEKFAELVATAEREACAKVCEQSGAFMVEEAIRARGNN